EARRNGGGVLVADRREVGADMKLVRGALAVKRPLAIAVAAAPIAPAAAAAAPAPMPMLAAAFAGALHRRTRLALRLAAEIFFGCAAVVVFVGDGMLGHGVVRELLALAIGTRLAAAATAAAAAPAPPAMSAVAMLALRRSLGRGRRRLFRGIEFGFRRLLGRRGLVVLDGLLDRLRAARGFGERSCRLDRMHLLAAVDDVGLLAGDGGVGRDGERHLEALLEGAKVRALVVEHVERHFRARAHDQIMGGA